MKKEIACCITKVMARVAAAVAGGRNESGAVRGGLLINQKPNQGSPYQQMPEGKHERAAAASAERGGGGKIAMRREREKSRYTFHCSRGSGADECSAPDKSAHIRSY
jgi:hypothetical protein